MTREEWEVFVSLYQDFRRQLEKVVPFLSTESFDYHTPEIYNDAAEVYSEYWDECDRTTSYTSLDIPAHFFIDGEKEQGIKLIEEQREKEKLAFLSRKQKEKEEAEERLRKQELQQLEDLKKKYESNTN